MKQFIKKDELKLIGSGYLTNSKEEPVNNNSFVKAQQHAEYIITFAEKAKGKDFKGKEANLVSALKKEVCDLLNGNKNKSYINISEEPKLVTTNKLKDEALIWIESQKNVERFEKINKFMQQFNSIEEFQTFGLFFESDIVKLNKIYTIEEILRAVISVIDLI